VRITYGSLETTPLGKSLLYIIFREFVVEARDDERAVWVTGDVWIFVRFICE